jgi:tetratricopeptide (TPR) repeat protein
LEWCNIGGKLEQALEYLQKSLAIREIKSPNSSAVAAEFRIKCFATRARDYDVPDHPYFMPTATNIADLALAVNNYDLALQYAEIVISRDLKNKFAYHTKSFSLS